MKNVLEISYVSDNHKKRFEKELNKHTGVNSRMKAVLYVMSATTTPDLFFNFDFVYPEVLEKEELENKVPEMDKVLYALGFNLYNGNTDIFGKETTPYLFSVLLKENSFVIGEALNLMSR